MREINQQKMKIEEIAFLAWSYQLAISDNVESAAAGL